MDKVKTGVRCQCRSSDPDTIVFKKATDFCPACGRGICEECGNHRMKIGPDRYLNFHACPGCARIAMDAQREVCRDYVGNEIQRRS